MTSGLDDVFKGHWSEADGNLYVSLNDTEAAPGTPFPYTVFEAASPSTQTRMSGSGRKKHYTIDQTWTFNVYAAPTSQKSAKEAAAGLGDAILKAFGGHPDTPPQIESMELDSGSVLLVQYQRDHFERQSDEIWKWSVEYNIKTDKPVMV